MVKKINSRTVLLLCGIGLFVTFVLGMNASYNMGFVNAGVSVCDPLTFGITSEGVYVCFNESLEESLHSNSPIANFSLEGLE